MLASKGHYPRGRLAAGAPTAPAASWTGIPICMDWRSMAAQSGQSCRFLPFLFLFRLPAHCPDICGPSYPQAPDPRPTVVVQCTFPARESECLCSQNIYKHIALPSPFQARSVPRLLSGTRPQHQDPLHGHATFVEAREAIRHPHLRIDITRCLRTRTKNRHPLDRFRFDRRLPCRSRFNNLRVNPNAVSVRYTPQKAPRRTQI
jgi:hypothetical protein